MLYTVFVYFSKIFARMGQLNDENKHSAERSIV